MVNGDVSGVPDDDRAASGLSRESGAPLSQVAREPAFSTNERLAGGDKPATQAATLEVDRAALVRLVYASRRERGALPTRKAP